MYWNCVLSKYISPIHFCFFPILFALCVCSSFSKLLNIFPVFIYFLWVSIVHPVHILFFPPMVWIYSLLPWYIYLYFCTPGHILFSSSMVWIYFCAPLVHIYFCTPGSNEYFCIPGFRFPLIFKGLNPSHFYLVYLRHNRSCLNNFIWSWYYLQPCPYCILIPVKLIFHYSIPLPLFCLFLLGGEID